MKALYRNYFLLSLYFLSHSFAAFADDCCEVDDSEGYINHSLFYEAQITKQNQPVEDCCGVWLPEDPVLFRPFVADPREVDYSAGWRFSDQVLDRNVIDVSYGDTIALYRLCNVGPWEGQLQFEVEGGLWAVFAPLQETSPLINADYYIGLPITYAFGKWSFRLRGYHISSHIGDEFLLCHPRFHRKNPSAESIDFFASWDATDEIRLYGGGGVVVHQDDTFKCGRVFAEGGMELHLSKLGFVNICQQIYGRPYYGMHFRYQTKQQKNHINQTYVLGYEWGKLCGLQRILRVFFEYHDGYSLEGQFCHFPTNYCSIRVSYGF